MVNFAHAPGVLLIFSPRPNWDGTSLERQLRILDEFRRYGPLLKPSDNHFFVQFQTQYTGSIAQAPRRSIVLHEGARPF
jgi:hypothetical protein